MRGVITRLQCSNNCKPVLSKKYDETLMIHVFFLKFLNRAIGFISGVINHLRTVINTSNI